MGKAKPYNSIFSAAHWPRPKAMTWVGAILLCAHSMEALAARAEPRPFRCQRAIVRQELNLLNRRSRATAACVIALLGCELDPKNDPQECRAKRAARCEKDLEALGRLAAGRTAKVVKACGDPMPPTFLADHVLGLGEVFSRCLGEGLPAEGTADLEACLAVETSRLASASAALYLPRACEVLTENGLALRFPTLACSGGPPGTCAGLGGNFSGVDFTDEEAHDVLDLANHGTADDLSGITGIGPSLAAAIMGGRPFADILELDATSGVGAGVLTNLREEVAALWCPTPPASCGCDA